MSRSSALLRSIPPATLAVLGICISIFLLQMISDLDLEKFTMCPRLVLYIHEYYRVFTSAVFHANIMHIGMNMLSTSAISSMLEKRIGTLRHIFSMLWAILLTAVIYLLIAWIAYAVFGYDKWMYQNSIGFSGIIFHMSVLECSLLPNQSRSIFGFFSVPSYLYPWALLVILQMLMPNLSFLGHLAGILTGTLQSYGFFEFILVGESFMMEMESWSALRWMTALPNFVSTSSVAGLLHQEPSALLHSLRKGIWMVFKFVRDILETVLVCIFGRGHRFNSNTRLWNAANTTSDGGRILGSANHNALEDDEEWVGLPTVASLEKKEPLSRLL
jgi:membrane associated rhomboid family serine protease